MRSAQLPVSFCEILTHLLGLFLAGVAIHAANGISGFSFELAHSSSPSGYLVNDCHISDLNSKLSELPDIFVKSQLPLSYEL